MKLGTLLLVLGLFCCSLETSHSDSHDDQFKLMGGGGPRTPKK